jgi:hypothetical protein
VVCDGRPRKTSFGASFYDVLGLVETILETKMAVYV